MAGRKTLPFIAYLEQRNVSIRTSVADDIGRTRPPHLRFQQSVNKQTGADDNCRNDANCPPTDGTPLRNQPAVAKDDNGKENKKNARAGEVCVDESPKRSIRTDPVSGFEKEKIADKIVQIRQAEQENTTRKKRTIKKKMEFQAKDSRHFAISKTDRETNGRKNPKALFCPSLGESPGSIE